MEIPVAVPKASAEPLPELADFLEPFAPVFRRGASRRSLERYVTGLLTDLPRKNCDTIAAAVAGTSAERLQHLLTDAEWDPEELDAARVRHLASRSPAGVLVLDNTDLPKQGGSSAGVARQYSGSMGKVANCQAVVSAEYVADEPGSRAPLHWPVAARLYLPEGWAGDPERKERARVPEGVGFRTKHEIALELVDEARGWGVPFGYAVADAGYGDNHDFLRGLEGRGVPYVCAVESTFGVRLPEEARAAAGAGPPPYGGVGRPPNPRPAPLYTAGAAVASLPEDAWRTVTWRKGAKGDLSKRAVAVRAHRATGGPHRSTSHGRVSTGPEGWLLAERPVPAEGSEGEAGETKYYFGTLPADAPLERLTELAHARWAIEQFYEDAKGECGLGDYQGRRYDGLHRHLALSMLAYSFLIIQSLAAPPGARPAEPRACGPLGGPFPPGAARGATGRAPAGTRVAAAGPRDVVHRDRPDQELPPAQELTE